MILHRNELTEVLSPICNTVAKVEDAIHEAGEIVQDIKSIGTDTAKIWKQPYGWIPFLSLAALVGLVIWALR
jgi:hypothetical protein